MRMGERASRYMGTMSDRDVCIIGAGSSGLAAAKVLHERGIPFDCFELGSGIGGLWRYNNDSGLSPAYKSLHINTSRDVTGFSDFPMPGDLPDFPHHSQMLEYFESYVDHFGFRDQITFCTKVVEVRPEDGAYLVVTEDRDGQRNSRRYGAVVVANGHHSQPRTPKFPGKFQGQTLHSRDYRTPAGLEDKRVLVVGMGNSGCDITCEVSRIANRTYLAARRGAHVIPKYLFGIPMDQLCPGFLWRWLPLSVMRMMFNVVLGLSRGRQAGYGVPPPQHRILEEHPTVSSDLLNLVGHGRIQIKPNVEELLGDRVRFSDGSVEEIDTIIFATGYQISFPFLDSSIVDSEDNEVTLYKLVAHPDYPGLYFVGLVQPWGAIMPLAEAQAKWVADLLEQKCGLPDRDRMLQDIEQDRRAMRKRYTQSARHTIQVDFFPYLAEIERARKRPPRRQPAAAATSPAEDPTGA